MEAFPDFNYSAPELICKNHPISNPIGICPFCLREKLNCLVCSLCGEQKFLCFCSDSKRNSSSSDVGSVGRISFLIENEKQRPIFEKSETGKENKKQRPNSRTPQIGIQSDQDRGDGPRKSGFWRIVRMFRKKREKGCSGRNSGFDERSEMWVLDQSGVSRSRSLCSFRESTSDFTFSSAKISDFTSSSERVSNFSEVEQRKSSFQNRGLRECDFANMDESAFIDLKLDLEKDEIKSKSDFGNRGLRSKAGDLRRTSCENRGLRSKTGDLGNIDKSGFIDMKLDLATRDSISDFGKRGIRDLRGGSCRVTERDRTGEFKREKKGMKVWRWILKHNSSWRSRSKRDYDINDAIRA